MTEYFDCYGRRLDDLAPRSAAHWVSVNEFDAVQARLRNAESILRVIQSGDMAPDFVRGCVDAHFEVYASDGASGGKS